MAQPCWHDVNIQTMDDGSPSRLEGAAEWVANQAGTFALDAGYLYYQPRVGENLTTADVELPVVEGLITGGGDQTTALSHVAFSGITFSLSAWNRPSTNNGYADAQAGVIFNATSRPDLPDTVPPVTTANPTPEPVNVNFYVQRQLHNMIMPGAIDLSYARNITLNNDTFTQLGAAAVHFGLGVTNSAVTQSTFTQISGSGIEVGDVIDPDSHHPANAAEIVQGNSITYNTISNVASQYTDAVGILVTYAANTLIAHNTVHDLPYTGISIGWGWGLPDNDVAETLKHYGIYEHGYLPQYTTPTTSAGTQVIHNLLYNVMQVHHDGGAIYSLGSQPGTLVNCNYIHDVQVASSAQGPFTAFGPGPSSALYLDEGTSYATWTNNVAINVATEIVKDLDISAQHDTVTNNAVLSSMATATPGQLTIMQTAGANSNGK
ncbi:hypothetical protein BCY88_15290 [Paraburkholderia fungorum]|uniref:Right handed beta helix domain-containing protein n=2 Tax=Paraburkholderia fungorum TaxID=134537 RepID=A0A420GYH0_9BURK|nr:hypothetical protein BCY88_15290 [Paraburkholderia fungorum]